MYRVYSDTSNGAAWFSQLKKIQELLWHDKIKCNAWKLQHYFEMRLPSCTDDSFNTWNSLSLGWSWLWWKSWCTSTLILAEKKVTHAQSKKAKIVAWFDLFLLKNQIFLFQMKTAGCNFRITAEWKNLKTQPFSLKTLYFQRKSNHLTFPNSECIELVSAQAVQESTFEDKSVVSDLRKDVQLWIQRE